MFDLLGQWASYPAFGDRVLSMIGIEVHWAILQYVIGLPFMAFIAELLYLKTGKEKWLRIAKTFAKGFVIVFAVGAATGTASEFGLVLLWPNLTEAAGRYIYFPLYAEIFAFLMEVVFIYMLWYGWNRMPPKIHVIVTFLAFLGAWYSAAMILSVNSYMVAPTGIVPAYNPETGEWLYAQGYPKITLVVPDVYVQVLNVSMLESLGMKVVGKAEYGVVVEMPARIVQRLAYEAWNGYTVKDSILALVANPEAVKANPALLNVSVKKIVDDILVATIKTAGIYGVTFASPVYPGTLLHTIGSALTVSSFTAMAGYALRLASIRGRRRDEYYDYVETGFKYTAFFALVVIAVQGFVFGHVMGEEIAHYNPEKFAAMEGTSEKILSLSRLLGLEGLMKIIAYGSPEAHLPDYDAIPVDYCACGVVKDEDMARIGDCRPPLMLHYIYYSKIGLGILLGLYALLVVFTTWRRGVASLPAFLLKLAPVAAGVAQLVSFMGWAVREIGRKPWTIYGVMTPDVAHTVNPPSPAALVLVAVYMLAMLFILLYAVWKFLWVPGRPGEEE